MAVKSDVSKALSSICETCWSVWLPGRVPCISALTGVGCTFCRRENNNSSSSTTTTTTSILLHNNHAVRKIRELAPLRVRDNEEDDGMGSVHDREFDASWMGPLAISFPLCPGPTPRKQGFPLWAESNEHTPCRR